MDFKAEGSVRLHERAARSAPSGINFRRPTELDGPQVTALIADCPPLDINSAYCNLLQCSHFADTCVVAERGGTVVGWISAYRPPSAPGSLFVWQVAVHASARGAGLGQLMLEWLISLPMAEGATDLTTTITAANLPSWAMFGRFARSHGLLLTKSAHFERETHFAGAHDTEWHVAIGPIERARKTLGQQENR